MRALQVWRTPLYYPTSRSAFVQLPHDGLRAHAQLPFTCAALSFLPAAATDDTPRIARRRWFLYNYIAAFVDVFLPLACYGAVVLTYGVYRRGLSYGHILYAAFLLFCYRCWFFCQPPAVVAARLARLLRLLTIAFAAARTCLPPAHRIALPHPC